MKKTVMLVAAIAVLNVLATERISVDEVVNHYPWDGKVDCSFSVSGLECWYNYKAVFMLSVKKRGSIVRRTVTNDLAAADGVYTNTFDCVELFGEGVYPNGGIAMDLVKESDALGAPIGIRGDVLVINVSGGSEAMNYPTSVLSDVDIGTFNCDAYKTDKIVLRKVPAGVYYCQPAENYLAADAVVSQQLSTRGFYIGVFPVTQRQYECVMGTNPSDFRTDDVDNVAAQRPVEHISWNTIRGSVAVGTAITVSSADSFFKRLVVKTGLSGFDLPTEAQWEIACRAGATAAYGAYWNGTEATELTATNIGVVAWHSGNCAGKPHAVGGKLPNMWGLYDMQGNVWEWCRDAWGNPYDKLYVDAPCTKEQGEGVYDVRVHRGGSLRYGPKNPDPGFFRPSYRSCDQPTLPNNDCGFRISRSVL